MPTDFVSPGGQQIFRRYFSASLSEFGRSQSSIDFQDFSNHILRVKAEEIIAEIKGLPPGDLAAVSAFMLKVEQEDPALQVALERMHQSDTGKVVSRPYQEVLASVRTALDRARE